MDKNKIRDYILENFLFTDDQSKLSNDDSFLDMGIIDSTGVLEIIVFLKKEFGIQVLDEEMIAENMDSVNNIVNYIETKTAINASN